MVKGFWLVFLLTFSGIFPALAQSAPTPEKNTKISLDPLEGYWQKSCAFPKDNGGVVIRYFFHDGELTVTKSYYDFLPDHSKRRLSLESMRYTVEVQPCGDNELCLSRQPILGSYSFTGFTPEMRLFGSIRSTPQDAYKEEVRWAQLLFANQKSLYLLTANEKGSNFQDDCPPNTPYLRVQPGQSIQAMVSR